MRSMNTHSHSPCAACKFLRRKCTRECVFAPHFPADQPQKFAYVHKIYGASNVAKILNDLNPAEREDAVKSLTYEAQARMRDPIYGCIGLISVLQNRLKQLQSEVFNARKELSTFIGPQAMLPIYQPPPVFGIQQQQANHVAAAPMVAIPMQAGGPAPLIIHDQLPRQQQHHVVEAQQFAPEVFIANDQQIKQHDDQDTVSFNCESGFSQQAGSINAATSGFTQMTMNSWGVGTMENPNNYTIQAQQVDQSPDFIYDQVKEQFLLHPQPVNVAVSSQHLAHQISQLKQQQQQLQKSVGDDGSTLHP